MHCHTTAALIRLCAVSLLSYGALVYAQTNVTYGKITAAKPVSVENGQAQVAGAVVGGTLGLISGRNQSSSNKALRATVGGVAGQQLAKQASGKQALEYTVLVEGRTTQTVVTDEAGMRVGDCVAVETGAYANRRLVPDARCTHGTKPTAQAKREATACSKAKDEVLAASDDEAFARAERKVRLLCAV